MTPDLLGTYSRLLTAEHALEAAVKLSAGSVYQRAIQRALFIVQLEKHAMAQDGNETQDRRLNI